jgi:hypothetical protein
MDLLRASASWRISAPVRVAGRLIRGIRKAALGLSRVIRSPSPDQTPPLARPPAALPSPRDPNEGAIFQATPFVERLSSEAEGVVTLETLYHLSRSL